MPEDLGVNVSDGIKTKEAIGGIGDSIDFNAIGLLYVNPETGQATIVRQRFVNEDKKLFKVKKGKKIDIRYRMEIK